MNQISFITTCKGRLHHVKKTLPYLVGIKPAEVVFVDYGCPDKSGQWVQENHPSVKVIYVDDDPGFCLPRARNIGAQNSTCPWLFFIDADIVVKPELGEWLSQDLDASGFYRSSLIDGVRDHQTWGSFLCHKDVFKKVGGYDEVFRGWGGEDGDIYRRISSLGLDTHFYPSESVTSIPHGHEERTKFQKIKDITLSHVVNETYMLAKRVLSSQIKTNGELSLASRMKIMEEVKASVVRWDAAGRPENFPLTLKSKSIHWLPKPYSLGAEISVQLMINNK